MHAADAVQTTETGLDLDVKGFALIVSKEDGWSADSLL